MSARWLWYLATAIPLGSLALSWVIHPQIFLATIIKSEGKIDGTFGKLYSAGRGAIFFTRSDLLHPETFGRPGQYIDGLIFAPSPNDPARAGQMRLSTWLLQISRAIRLQDSEGRALPGLVHSDADSRLVETFADQSEQLQSHAPTILELPVPSQTGFRHLTGIRVIVGFTLGDAGRLDRDGIRDQLARVLSAAKTAVLRAGGHGIGIPCLSTAGSDQNPGREAGCDQNDWFELLGALQRAQLLDRNFDSIVLGGWAKTPEAIARNAALFEEAWSRWVATVATETETAAHEGLRLSMLTVFAAFLGSAFARKAFRLWRALAIVVISGTVVGAATQILSFAEPLWIGAASPVVVLGAKAAICLVAGFLIDRFVGFDATKALSPTAL